MPQRSTAAGPRPAFQVLERTFGILEVFTEASPEWTATDVARALDLPVPTVHRILGALRRLGYVSQHEETRRFRLGLAAVRLGERARGAVDLRPVAVGPLRRLAAATGETALLTVPGPDRDTGVCLDRVETSQPLRLSVQPGRQLALHAGASQKALLAFMPDADVERLLARPLERFCTSTVTDPQALRAELALIRQRGWASSYEETNVGVWGVAVPVLSEADVVCAVGIAGPDARMSAERVRRDVRHVHAAARAVAATLGLRVPAVRSERTSARPAGGHGRRDRKARA